MSGGVLHWWALGGSWAWLWLLPLAAGIGLALKWIHIYLRPLHRALQLFWMLGVGPLFAALAGIGFKEFFCFQRPEAIGLTLLAVAAALLVVLALRKFGMEAAADVGDKTVF